MFYSSRIVRFGVFAALYVIFSVTLFSAVGKAEVTFQRADDPLQQEGVSDLATGDFNRDGRKDFVVANRTGGITLYFNDGFGYNGTKIYLEREEITSVAVGDFNRDGGLEIVATRHAAPSSIIILRWYIEGESLWEYMRFALSDASASGPVDVQLGDFNGDKNLDIATANSYSNNVTILAGRGNGAFGSMQSIASGTDPAQLRVADINHDGADDIFARTLKNLGLFYIRGQSSGMFPSSAQHILTNSWSYGFAVGDVDNDGNEDLVLCSLWKLEIHKGYGDERFEHLQTVDPLGGSYDVNLADANDDGKTDIYLVQGYPHNFVVLENTGTSDRFTSVLAKTPLKNVAQKFFAEDLDGDKDPDGVLTSSFMGRVSLLMNTIQSHDLVLKSGQSFDEVEMNSRATIQASLENSDTTAVRVSDVWFSGTDKHEFTVQETDCTQQKDNQPDSGWIIPARTTCHLTIGFAPGRIGLHRAVFKVATDAVERKTKNTVYQLALAATGIPAQQEKIGQGLNAHPLVSLSFLSQNYRWRLQSKKALRVTYRTNFDGTVGIALQRCVTKKKKVTCSSRSVPLASLQAKTGVSQALISPKALRKIKRGTYRLCIRQKGDESVQAFAWLKVL